MAHSQDICGLYFVGKHRVCHYLAPLSLSAHTTIVGSSSRTSLTQTFVNGTGTVLPELRYTFPVYDGVSVVGFTCTINHDRVIRGVVKERHAARATYDDAVRSGKTAGLLEQLPVASDVFTTTVGNIPSGAELLVELVYLGELKQDTQLDGLRFTIPTAIAPRYGDYPGKLATSTNVRPAGGIKIVVDAQTSSGSNIQNVQSPSHPISVTLGNTSAGAAAGTEMSLQKASATLALDTTELGKDFVLQLVATNLGEPVALLETHPTLPDQRALMATLVPKFGLPPVRPEIVFICDRSGSMGDGAKIPNLKAALHVFLKSLPVGIKFNICSFGSDYEFLFKRSKTYDADSLAEATAYVDKFDANFGGTEMEEPISAAFEKRYGDVPLELFLLTDGEIWNQSTLFSLIAKHVEATDCALRLFSLGIGASVSHALIEGVARAGNGFAQTVAEGESMNTKVVRMLKAALTPHVQDYTLEVKYGAENDGNDDFVVVEKATDTLPIRGTLEETPKVEEPKKPISLYDPSAKPDVEMTDPSSGDGSKFAGLPDLPEPKLLQAPTTIPPLYPFIRTNVYLLLSAQKTPASVVLRATSAHGPLELEIPVSVVAEKAQTIHQLAARAAIRELEEGRGWIEHVRDAADGQLFKDKMPSQFDNMVEREGVRLGVQFQVANKWCSFVAVEEDGDKNAQERDAGVVTGRSFQQPAMLGRARHRPRPMSQQPVGALFSTSQMARKAPGTSLRFSSANDGLVDRYRSYRSDARCASTRDESPEDVGFSLFGDDPAAPATSVGGAGMTESSEDGETDDSLGFGESAAPPPPMAPGAQKKKKQAGNKETASSQDSVFATIVRLQSFEGFWKWDEEVLAPLSVYDPEPLLARAGDALGLGGPAEPSDKLATGFVLAYLEREMADRREEWEMMASKARAWLDAHTADGQTGVEYVATISGVWSAIMQD